MRRWITTLALVAALSGMALADSVGGDRLINQGKEGQTFDFTPALVHGKINIVDFYSQYCPPCRAVMPRLEKLSEKDPSVLVLRVDINRPGTRGIDWQSPVAHQYKLRSIPHFVVYDADGKVMATDEGGDAASRLVYGMLAKAGL